MKKAKVDKQMFTITRSYNNSDRRAIAQDVSKIKEQILNFIRTIDNSNAIKIRITIKVKN